MASRISNDTHNGKSTIVSSKPRRPIGPPIRKNPTTNRVSLLSNPNHLDKLDDSVLFDKCIANTSQSTPIFPFLSGVSHNELVPNIDKSSKLLESGNYSALTLSHGSNAILTLMENYAMKLVDSAIIDSANAKNINDRFLDQINVCTIDGFSQFHALRRLITVCAAESHGLLIESCWRSQQSPMYIEKCLTGNLEDNVCDEVDLDEIMSSFEEYMTEEQYALLNIKNSRKTFKTVDKNNAANDFQPFSVDLLHSKISKVLEFREKTFSHCWDKIENTGDKSSSSSFLGLLDRMKNEDACVFYQFSDILSNEYERGRRVEIPQNTGVTLFNLLMKNDNNDRNNREKQANDFSSAPHYIPGYLHELDNEKSDLTYCSSLFCPQNEEKGSNNNLSIPFIRNNILLQNQTISPSQVFCSSPSCNLILPRHHHENIAPSSTFFSPSVLCSSSRLRTGLNLTSVSLEVLEKIRNSKSIGLKLLSEQIKCEKQGKESSLKQLLIENYFLPFHKNNSSNFVSIDEEAHKTVDRLEKMGFALLSEDQFDKCREDGNQAESVSEGNQQTLLVMKNGLVEIAFFFHTMKVLRIMCSSLIKTLESDGIFWNSPSRSSYKAKMMKHKNCGQQCFQDKLGEKPHFKQNTVFATGLKKVLNHMLVQDKNKGKRVGEGKNSFFSILKETFQGVSELKSETKTKETQIDKESCTFETKGLAIHEISSNLKECLFNQEEQTDFENENNIRAPQSWIEKSVKQMKDNYLSFFNKLQKNTVSGVYMNSNDDNNSRIYSEEKEHQSKHHAVMNSMFKSFLTLGRTNSKEDNSSSRVRNMNETSSSTSLKAPLTNSNLKLTSESNIKRFSVTLNQWVNTKNSLSNKATSSAMPINILPHGILDRLEAMVAAASSIEMQILDFFENLESDKVIDEELFNDCNLIHTCHNNNNEIGTYTNSNECCRCSIKSSRIQISKSFKRACTFVHWAFRNELRLKAYSTSMTSPSLIPRIVFVDTISQRLMSLNNPSPLFDAINWIQQMICGLPNSIKSTTLTSTAISHFDAESCGSVNNAIEGLTSNNDQIFFSAINSASIIKSAVENIRSTAIQKMKFDAERGALDEEKIVQFVWIAANVSIAAATRGTNLTKEYILSNFDASYNDTSGLYNNPVILRPTSPDISNVDNKIQSTINSPSFLTCHQPLYESCLPPFLPLSSTSHAGNQATDTKSLSHYIPYSQIVSSLVKSNITGEVGNANHPLHGNELLIDELAFLVRRILSSAHSSTLHISSSWNNETLFSNLNDRSKTNERDTHCFGLRAGNNNMRSIITWNTSLRPIDLRSVIEYSQRLNEKCFSSLDSIETYLKKPSQTCWEFMNPLREGIILFNENLQQIKKMHIQKNSISLNHSVLSLSNILKKIRTFMDVKTPSGLDLDNINSSFDQAYCTTETFEDSAWERINDSFKAYCCIDVAPALPSINSLESHLPLPTPSPPLTMESCPKAMPDIQTAYSSRSDDASVIRFIDGGGFTTMFKKKQNENYFNSLMNAKLNVSSSKFTSSSINQQFTKNKSSSQDVNSASILKSSTKSRPTSVLVKSRMNKTTETPSLNGIKKPLILKPGVSSNNRQFSARKKDNFEVAPNCSAITVVRKDSCAMLTCSSKSSFSSSYIPGEEFLCVSSKQQKQKLDLSPCQTQVLNFIKNKSQLSNLNCSSINEKLWNLSFRHSLNSTAKIGTPEDYLVRQINNSWLPSFLNIFTHTLSREEMLLKIAFIERLKHVSETKEDNLESVQQLRDCASILMDSHILLQMDENLTNITNKICGNSWIRDFYKECIRIERIQFCGSATLNSRFGIKNGKFPLREVLSCCKGIHAWSCDLESIEYSVQNFGISAYVRSVGDLETSDGAIFVVENSLADWVLTRCLVGLTFFFQRDYTIEFAEQAVSPCFEMVKSAKEYLYKLLGVLLMQERNYNQAKGCTRPFFSYFDTPTGSSNPMTLSILIDTCGEIILDAAINHRRVIILQKHSLHPRLHNGCPVPSFSVISFISQLADPQQRLLCVDSQSNLLHEKAFLHCSNSNRFPYDDHLIPSISEVITSKLSFDKTCTEYNFWEIVCNTIFLLQETIELPNKTSHSNENQLKTIVNSIATHFASVVSSNQDANKDHSQEAIPSSSCKRFLINDKFDIDNQWDKILIDMSILYFGETAQNINLDVILSVLLDFLCSLHMTN